MLKKIVSIKNVGKFRNSAAKGNPELARNSFILGANGFGKTTICAVLRSLQSGDADHIMCRRTLGVEDTPSRRPRHGNLVVSHLIREFPGTPCWKFQVHLGQNQNIELRPGRSPSGMRLAGH